MVVEYVFHILNTASFYFSMVRVFLKMFHLKKAFSFIDIPPSLKKKKKRKTKNKISAPT